MAKLGACGSPRGQQELAQSFGLPRDGFEDRKGEVNDIVAAVVALQASMAQPAGTAPFIEQALANGKEDPRARQQVYLVTVSRVLPATLANVPGFRDLAQLSREDIANAMRDALENPMKGDGGGRPRPSEPSSRVSALVVFQEAHADQSVHFHVVVRLTAYSRFAAAKRTLREKHGLPSHWSCSHKQFWSALRRPMCACVWVGVFLKEGDLEWARAFDSKPCAPAQMRTPQESIRPHSLANALACSLHRFSAIVAGQVLRGAHAHEACS